MTEPLDIVIRRSSELSPFDQQTLIALCSRAYETDFSDLFELFGPATHVLGYRNKQLVSHALWIPRTLHYATHWLQCAYVEAVATEPQEQGNGYASQVLRALVAAIHTFDLGVLSPFDPAFYRRLGWESWRGPLFVASDDGVQPTPGEDVMIYRLPNTPPLDLEASLTAPWRKGDIW